MNKTETLCYIAGKIGGLEPESYIPNFSIAENEVRELGFKAVNPCTLPHNHGRTYWEYMREDVSNMLKCSHVYAMRNWKDSRGATIEIGIAKQFELTIIYQI